MLIGVIFQAEILLSVFSALSTCSTCCVYFASSVYVQYVFVWFLVLLNLFNLCLFVSVFACMCLYVSVRTDINQHILFLLLVFCNYCIICLLLTCEIFTIVAAGCNYD